MYLLTRRPSGRPLLDPISERGLQQAMVYKKRGHFYTVFIEDDTFDNVMAQHLDAVRRPLLVDVTAHVNVEDKRVLEMLHHRGCTGWSPHLQRHGPSASRPACQEQVRNLDHMIGMQMRQEQPVDRSDWDTDLRQTQRRPPAASKITVPDRLR